MKIILIWDGDEGRSEAEATVDVNVSDLLKGLDDTQENRDDIEVLLQQFSAMLANTFEADHFFTEKQIADHDKHIEEEMKKQ